MSTEPSFRSLWARRLVKEKLSYDILEGSDRVGGRMLTHYFSDKEHDYYDIGAMAFPDIPVMQRTFKLFTKLNISTTPPMTPLSSAILGHKIPNASPL